MKETGHWVRLTRMPYKGDLALIMWVNAQQDTMDVICIPRIYYSTDKGKQKRGTRPSKALFEPGKCKRPMSKLVVPGGYRFKNQEFDSAGYVTLKDLHSAQYRTVDRAARHEYIPFSSCNAVGPSVIHLAMKLLANRTLKRWDRVCVIDGQFQGCIGTVEEVHVHHVNVEFLDDVYEGIVELPLLFVTRCFEVENRVLVNTSSNNGTHRYIVSADIISDLITVHSLQSQVMLSDSFNSLHRSNDEFVLGFRRCCVSGQCSITAS